MSRAEGWLADLKLSPNQHFMHGLVKMSESRPLMELRKLKVMADTFDNDAANRAARGISWACFQADSPEGPVTTVYD